MTNNEHEFNTSRFTELIQNAKSIAITTHVNPDGDALGSEIGLAEWLLSIGKSVSVINHSPVPYNYTFLDTERSIVEQFDATKHDAKLKACDLILVLDVNDPDRVRSLGSYVTNSAAHVAVIDHHLEPKKFAHDYFVDTDACSTGEMIYKLIEAATPLLGGALSKKGATALYVAIMTDTGSFRFPRTDAEVFRICADLLDLGADPVQCYDETYNSSPPARLLLIREALNSLVYKFDNRMALQTLTQEQLKKVGATEEDVDGFVQMPFQVRGIVLSVLLLQLKDGWKLSARSKGEVSAAKVAQTFGGNGHFHAAGARTFSTLSVSEMQKEVIEVAKGVLAS